MVAPVPFFPTPYPDETLYSVICRYWLKSGRPAYRNLSEELFGRRVILNTYTPQCIGVFTQRIPQETGLTPNYFIARTTAFPYFSPFLTQSKTDAFLEYMKKAEYTSKNNYFALGTGKLRQPKNLYMRFCESCRKEDVERFGETYWHRTHQMNGVLICCRHMEPLMDSEIVIPLANKSFYPASDEPSRRGMPCGYFSDSVTEKLIALSADTDWLLENGSLHGGSEKTYDNYDSWLRITGFRTLHGRTQQKKIFQAIREMYGDEFLNLIKAYDEYDTSTWPKRILFYPEKLVHPMFHLLLIRLLAGSAQAFFETKREKPQPYGKGPWPCRNPICPHNRQDVIESISMRYDRGFYRTLFECPHCGFAYRRKHPIPKEQQYDGHVYISEYGSLWKLKLRECLIGKEMSTRRTCELLECDLYTVHKYAVELGMLKLEDVTFLEKRKKGTSQEQSPAALTVDEERAMYRNQWTQLICDTSNATRSLLITLNPAAYLWLRKNDLSWYERYSPKAKFVSMDWTSRDDEILPQIRAAVTFLRNTDGKPRWVNKGAVMTITGLHQLGNKKAMARLPKTAEYLTGNLESIVDWRKRKIIWAIQKLRKDEAAVTPNKIKIAASISHEAFLELNLFILECLELL